MTFEEQLRSKTIEDIIRGLAHSNFHLKFDRRSDPGGIMVGKQEHRKIIGPEEGTLRYEHSHDKGENIFGCCSNKPGVVYVFTNRGTYVVHQTTETMPRIKYEICDISTYRKVVNEGNQNN